MLVQITQLSTALIPVVAELTIRSAEDGRESIEIDARTLSSLYEARQEADRWKSKWLDSESKLRQMEDRLEARNREIAALQTAKALIEENLNAALRAEGHADDRAIHQAERFVASSPRRRG